MRRENVLVERSLAFAVRIVKLYKYLCEEKKEYVMSKQILRSGTAIGALVREAQNAESTKDFIHKLSIAQKECDETCYWLELLKRTDFLTENEFIGINNDSIELLKMLRSAIITSKSKL
ncbi:MAG: four helix bundle protein [Dysgonamonadaceae bacterium]|nr:four helix bundle protein [Dysgonamonadaceae bacterium]MDD4728486.1 four helix bundle protein [Dysgonamonadaceae bacterium]